MPLIIITGTPCSGKTYRARQILKEFESRAEAFPGRSIVYLPSHHASIDPPSQGDESYIPPTPSENPRDVIYDLARLEKTARAEEFSAIKRAVNKNAIVIADAPNYIKGFRYQLFCEAKAASTRSVVVHTAAREDECVAWNNARLEAWGWSTSIDVTAETSKETVGPRVGKDVLGNLEPESHTAIFGDKILNETAGSRSRSSSTGAADGDSDSADSTHKKVPAEDTMTLKSLWISDNQDTNTNLPQTGLDQIVPRSVDQTSTPSQNLPLPIPPSPKSSLPYSPTTLRSLFMRYEPPSPFTRWDTPLFTVPSTDPHPPYDQIWDAIFPPSAKSTSKKAIARERQEQERAQKEQIQAQAPHQQNGTNLQSLPPHNHLREQSQGEDNTPLVKPHAATVLPSATAPNALQTLESTTNEITKLVLAAARAAHVADGEDYAMLSITLPIPEEGENEQLVLEMEKQEGISVSQPKLQRLRRKFTQIQRGGIAHGQGHAVGRRAVGEEFARFLEGEWRGEWEGMNG